MRIKHFRAMAHRVVTYWHDFETHKNLSQSEMSYFMDTLVENDECQGKNEN